ncbi:hypothetical protein L3Q67_44130 [Saccharothrix sp. AJ9571]|nr:hypothetical protein L3Q67_44130 [Saccharothrix sp. AJ9571]
MTTIHSHTDDQPGLNNPQQDPRWARSAAVDMISTSTAKAIAGLAGKFASAVRSEPPVGFVSDGGLLRWPVPIRSSANLRERRARRCGAGVRQAAQRSAARNSRPPRTNSGFRRTTPPTDGSSPSSPTSATPPG